MSGVEHRTRSRADQSFLVICVRSRRTLPQGTVRCGKWRSGDFQHPAAAPRCHHSPLQDRSRGPRSHGCYRAGFDRLPRTGCSQLAGCSQDRRRAPFPDGRQGRESHGRPAFRQTSGAHHQSLCRSPWPDASAFGGHSLRSGFLTSAAARGANIFKMADQSGHKSMDTLRGYVRNAEIFQDHAGAGLLSSRYPPLRRPALFPKMSASPPKAAGAVQEPMSALGHKRTFAA